MFGFFKNLFVSKTAEDTVQEAPVFQPAPAAPAAPTAPAARPLAAKAVTQQAPVAPAAPRMPVKARPQPAAPPPSNGSRPDSVDISLQMVLNGLPPELKNRVRQMEVGEATISISTEKILSQLASGSVKLSFGELRRAGPQLFAPGADADQMPVALPLNEILSRLNPAMLTRRQNQKYVEVPEEISSPFNDRGSGLVFSVGPNKSAEPVQARSTAPAPAAPVQPIQPIQPKPVQPKPAPVMPPQPTPVQHRPVQPTPVQPRPVPSAPVQPAPVQPIAFPSAPFRQAPSPVSSVPTPPPPTAIPDDIPEIFPISPGLRKAASPIPSNTPQPPRAAVPQPAMPTQGSFMSAPLAALAAGWPEALRQEIVQLNLVDAKLALPAEEIEDSMKRGRVAFPWKVVRSWIRPAPLPTLSVHDAAVVELPLKVLMPLFLARKKEAAPISSKVAIDQNIPNLFFGFPQPEAPAPAPAPAAPAMPATPAIPAAPAGIEDIGDVFPFAPVSQPVAEPTSDTNYFIREDSVGAPQSGETELKRKAPGTDFTTRYATPNEIVTRAAALDGVAGALVALPDGLMVAAKVSPDLNGDTLAAFLPHIFGKVNQCTKELRMGELNNLNFTVGNVPWKIFRVNAIFFAAFGRVGQALPTAQLAALAGELDHKKQ
jgi:predicted regulator of Ras-like GTPase activity (Roadblock/LC7/MglB family)